MIEIVWDDTLPPKPARTEEEEALEQWDQWFTAVGMSEEWDRIKEACKSVGYTNKEILNWATVLELTRLKATTKNGSSNESI